MPPRAAEVTLDTHLRSSAMTRSGSTALRARRSASLPAPAGGAGGRTEARACRAWRWPRERARRGDRGGDARSSRRSGVGKRTASGSSSSCARRSGRRGRRDLARAPAAATPGQLARQGLLELGFAARGESLLATADGESAEECSRRASAYRRASAWQGADRDALPGGRGRLRAPRCDHAARRVVGQSSSGSSSRLRSRPRRARGEALDHVLLAGPPGLGSRSRRSSPPSSAARSSQTAGPALDARVTSPRSSVARAAQRALRR